MELDYRGGKVVAMQVWVASLPDIGTVILGTTPEEAQQRLKEYARGQTPWLNAMEVELRLILANPNAEQRLQALSDWLKLKEHEAGKMKS
jgi:predicted RNase H-like HicB family nuclease